MERKRETDKDTGKYMKDKEFERKRKIHRKMEIEKEREKITINSSYKLYKHIRFELKNIKQVVEM